MASPHRKKSERQLAALDRLAPFLDRLLPGMLRRQIAWRRLAPADRHDLRAELQQELRLDCLQHLDVVLASSDRDLNQRWFRLVERWVYWHRRRGHRAEPDLEPTAPDIAGSDPTVRDLQQLLPGLSLPQAERLIRRTRRHGNGRPNAAATAQGLGLHPSQVRGLWARVAERLGYDAEFLAFWRRRLAEALVGLAADRLLDGNELHVLPRPRRVPDPVGRLARIRRIRSALAVRPVPFELRRLLAQVLRSPRSWRPEPTMLLAAAAELQPDDACIALWQFEAAAAAHDLSTAGNALARARHHDVDRTALLLARARLLELRCQPQRALRLLRRAAARQRPADGRLALALAWSNDAESAVASASPSARSSEPSGRGRVQFGTASNQPMCR